MWLSYIIEKKGRKGNGKKGEIIRTVRQEYKEYTN